jgi:hypothetical protein
VRIDYVTNPYWAKHFDGIRRVAGLNTTPILDTPNTPQQVPPSIMPPHELASVENAPSSVADTARDAPIAASTYTQNDRNATRAMETQPALAAAPLRAGMSGPVITDPIALEIARADREADVHDMHDMRGTAGPVSNYQNHAEAATLYTRPASAYQPAPTADRPRTTINGRIITPPIAATGNDDDPIARLARGY